MTVGCTLAVIALAVVEGLSGPEVVADVAGLVGVVLLALSVAATLLRLAARRTRGNWPSMLQLGLGVLAVLLMCVVGTVAGAHRVGTFRGPGGRLPAAGGLSPRPGRRGVRRPRAVRRARRPRPGPCPRVLIRALTSRRRSRRGPSRPWRGPRAAPPASSTPRSRARRRRSPDRRRSDRPPRDVAGAQQSARLRRGTMRA